MGNEESHEQRKGTRDQTSNSKNYPQQQHNSQPPMAPFHTPTPGNNYPQSPQPGWVLPTANEQGNLPNMNPQNRIYPNLPSSYHTASQPHHVIQQQIPSQPTAPPMFYPQAQVPSNQFNQQQPQQQHHNQYQQSTILPPNVSQTIVPYNLNDIWSRGTHIPSNAFRAGHDTDGTVLHICRAAHEGDLLPGKLVPTHTSAYVSHNGMEIPKNNFEILIGDQYRWIPSGNGQIPAGAVEGGRTVQGEKLYIGRVPYNHSLTPGKLHPSHGCLYIPYGGDELAFKEYEVLVHTNFGPR